MKNLAKMYCVVFFTLYIPKTDKKLKKNYSPNMKTI